MTPWFIMMMQPYRLRDPHEQSATAWMPGSRGTPVAKLTSISLVGIASALTL